MTSTGMPTFILGLGAQKSGTTWLYEYLNHFSNADFGDLKEYHIWDAATLSELKDFDAREHKRSLRQKLRIAKRSALGHAQEPVIIRQNLQSDPEAYFDYFARLLDQPNITLTGDITPSYSGLSEQTITQIKGGFSKRGIHVKAVFLMRDPMERSLSAIRMYRRNGVSRQGVDITMTDDDALLSYLQTTQFSLRGNYHETIERIQKIFSNEDIHLGLYEEMFTDSEIVRVSDFCQLQTNLGFRDQKFNQTKPGTLDLDEISDEAWAHLAPIYEYCANALPQTRELWAWSHHSKLHNS